jgi:predicted nucleotidyltransferase
MTSSALSIPQQTLADFCRRWKIRELALFGSALREDFRPDSDIDLLVTFSGDADWGLLAHIQMQQELESILERPVDFISRRALEESPNWLRRHAILDTAQILYRRDEANNGT